MTSPWPNPNTHLPPGELIIIAASAKKGESQMCPRCCGKKHPPAPGLTADCFNAIRRAVKQLPDGMDKYYALSCLAEIGCQMTQLTDAKRRAENDLQELAQDAEQIRQNLHKAHVDFGGVIDDRYDA